MNRKELLHQTLGTIAFLLLMVLVYRQETVVDYQMSKLTLTILLGAVWAYQQVKIVDLQKLLGVNSNQDQEKEDD